MIDRYDSIKRDEAKKYLDSIEKQINNRFDEIRNIAYNTNTKGFDYEKALRKLYHDYFGDALRFAIRVGILDAELKIDSILNPSENEFDIVAIYKDAIPQQVLHRHIPYDSVAFITELKQTLNSCSLKHDLSKLNKLNSLKDNNYRFKLLNALGWSPQIKRPIRILVYFESSLTLETVEAKLNEEYERAWDIFVILEKKFVAVNSTFSWVESLFKEKDRHYLVNRTHPFASLILSLCKSLPPSFVDGSSIFWNLLRSQ